MTPGELAAELSVDAKRIRKWLRETWPPLHPHTPWDLTPEQAQAVRDYFAPKKHAAATAAVPVATSVVPATTAPLAATIPGPWSAWTPLLTALETAPREPGVYMARQGFDGPVVYVGMAGERRGQGIRGRLAIYVSGKGLVSGLGEAVFDRALADVEWLEDRLAEARAGKPQRAKLWGRAAMARADVQVRWQTTADRASAMVLEMHVMRAQPQEPLWNRYR